nr:hypothetical protein Q903MT_gene4407 [Picea sitchensis]
MLYGYRVWFLHFVLTMHISLRMLMCGVIYSALAILDPPTDDTKVLSIIAMAHSVFKSLP